MCSRFRHFSSVVTFCSEGPLLNFIRPLPPTRPLEERESRRELLEVKISSFPKSRCTSPSLIMNGIGFFSPLGTGNSGFSTPSLLGRLDPSPFFNYLRVPLRTEPIFPPTPCFLALPTLSFPFWSRSPRRKPFRTCASPWVLSGVHSPTAPLLSWSFG